MKRPLHFDTLLGVLIVVATSPLAGSQAQDNHAPKTEWTWKAVAISTDENEATKKLNELAVSGWEYVGPLTQGLVAFKIRTRAAYVSEMAKFQGTWTWEGFTATYNGENLEVYQGDTFYSKGMFKIDPLKRPITFEYIAVEGAHQGDTLVGIYEFENDMYRICHVTRSSQKPRPTEFSTDEKGGDTLQIWNRKK